MFRVAVTEEEKFDFYFNEGLRLLKKYERLTGEFFRVRHEEIYNAFSNADEERNIFELKYLLNQVAKIVDEEGEKQCLDF